MISTFKYTQGIENQIKQWEKEYNQVMKSELPGMFFLNHFNKISVFGIQTADCINNKEITFNIASGVSCSFKCCPEHPEICQNNPLCSQPIVPANIKALVNKYREQELATCITFQGLEPLDTLSELMWFIWYLRHYTDDPVFIWTGYTEEEIQSLIELIHRMNFCNIYIKVGRFVPNQPSHIDPILGVALASPNQYCKKIS